MTLWAVLCLQTLKVHGSSDAYSIYRKSCLIFSASWDVSSFSDSSRFFPTPCSHFLHFPSWRLYVCSVISWYEHSSCHHHPSNMNLSSCKLHHKFCGWYELIYWCALFLPWNSFQTKDINFCSNLSCLLPKGTQNPLTIKVV